MTDKQSREYERFTKNRIIMHPFIVNIEPFSVGSILYQFGRNDSWRNLAENQIQTHATMVLELVNSYSPSTHYAALAHLLKKCLIVSGQKLTRKEETFFRSRHPIPIPGFTGELWSGFTFTPNPKSIPVEPASENPKPERFLFRIELCYEVVEYTSILKAFNSCRVKEENGLDNLVEELVGKTVFCDPAATLFVILKVNLENCETETENNKCAVTLAESVEKDFAKEFGIKLRKINIRQPLLECRALDGNPNTKPKWLLSQFCFLFGARFEIGNVGNSSLDLIDFSNLYITARNKIEVFMKEFQKSDEAKIQLNDWGIKLIGQIYNSFVQEQYHDGLMLDLKN